MDQFLIDFCITKITDAKHDKIYFLSPIEVEYLNSFRRPIPCENYPFLLIRYSS